MRDYINIGSAPYEEPCAQVGAPDYQRQAGQECTRFIDLLHRTVGEEPENAHLAIKSNPHDVDACSQRSEAYTSERRVEAAGYREALMSKENRLISEIPG